MNKPTVSQGYLEALDAAKKAAKPKKVAVKPKKEAKK